MSAIRGRNPHTECENWVKMVELCGKVRVLK